MRYHGRREPYTERGIRRVPCIRCGAPGRYQWQVCANARRHIAICAACDIDLNRLVLDWAGIPNAGELLASYEKKVRDG